MEVKEKTGKNKLECEVIKVQLAITTDKTEKFIDELEKLCEKFSDNKDFFLSFNKGICIRAYCSRHFDEKISKCFFS